PPGLRHIPFPWLRHRPGTQSSGPVFASLPACVPPSACQSVCAFPNAQFPCSARRLPVPVADAPARRRSPWWNTPPAKYSPNPAQPSASRDESMSTFSSKSPSGHLAQATEQGQKTCPRSNHQQGRQQSQHHGARHLYSQFPHLGFQLQATLLAQTHTEAVQGFLHRTTVLVHLHNQATDHGQILVGKAAGNPLQRLFTSTT